MDRHNILKSLRVITIGKRTIHSSNFMGGSRNQRECYMDAMSKVTKYERSDLFITLTFYRNWKELS